MFDDEHKKTEPFRDIYPFMRRSRILYAITTHCMPYTSIIRDFWSKAVINCETKETFIESEVQGKKVIVTEAIIREVLKFGDKAEDPKALDERLVKGCFQRMGYTGEINATRYNKGCLPRP